MRSMR